MKIGRDVADLSLVERRCIGVENLNFRVLHWVGGWCNGFYGFGGGSSGLLMGWGKIFSKAENINVSYVADAQFDLCVQEYFKMWEGASFRL